MKKSLSTTVLVLLVSSNALAVSIQPMVIDSPPPELVSHSSASLTPEQLMAAKTLSGVPASSWWYGCTATSAGMLFGYYDSHGYPNMFAGDIVGDIDTATERALIATQDHIDDYWIAYDSAGPDPWEANGWTEHTWGTCTADFLGTSQWKWDYSSFPSTDGTRDTNTDGATTLWFFSDGSPTYDVQIGALMGVDYGQPDTGLTHGLRMFAESRGYSVAFENGEYQSYNQYVDAMDLTYGFTYADYMAEIDAGRPVLLHVTGHTMLGIGYDDTNANNVILYDTWDYDTHSMEWGTSYAARRHEGVTVLKLAPAPTQDVPEPGTCALFGLGLIGFVAWRRRKAA